MLVSCLFPPIHLTERWQPLNLRVIVPEDVCPRHVHDLTKIPEGERAVYDILSTEITSGAKVVVFARDLTQYP